MGLRRYNREISIFNMSALDLFASALGAFILISVILFPFFPTTEEEVDTSGLEAELASALEEVQALMRQIEDLEEDALNASVAGDQEAAAIASLRRAERDLRQCSADLADTESDLEDSRQAEERTSAQVAELEGELESCYALSRRTFVLIVISWSSRDDVDLHVIDPQGREFYWRERNFPGTPARLEEDNIFGPGNEIWLHPAAQPGDYEILYKYYTKRSRRAEVRGAVLVQTGRIELPSVVLTQEDEKPSIATIRIDPQFNVTVSP